MLVALSTSAEIVAWICFALGVALVIAGVVIGLYLSFKKTVQDVKKKVAEASTKMDALRTRAVAGALTTQADQGAADDVQAKAAEMKSTLGEIGELIGSLPEKLRFAGLLVLIGTVLMSVATVQFGGTSIF